MQKNRWEISSHFAAGVYLVKIVTKEGEKVRKIVK